jgi:hypothetical protein
MRSELSFQPRRGDRPIFVCRPSGAPEYISPSVPVVTLALHHRLMSTGASGAKTCLETLTHNFEKENLK